MRRHKVSFVLLVFCPGAVLALGSLAVSGGEAAPGKHSPRFKITTRRADDKVEVGSDQKKTVFTLHSPFGISQMVIERLDDDWPKAVVLRLHLKGLSSFRASNGKVRLDAAVSLQQGQAQVRVWKDGKEDAVLDEKSPLWLDVRILGSDGKAARELPLQNGYFEVTLPRALFEDRPQSLTLNWIDFYRQ